MLGQSGSSGASGLAIQLANMMCSACLGPKGKRRAAAVRPAQRARVMARVVVAVTVTVVVVIVLGTPRGSQLGCRAGQPV